MQVLRAKDDKGGYGSKLSDESRPIERLIQKQNVALFKQKLLIQRSLSPSDKYF